jgi:hypothetical protein
VSSDDLERLARDLFEAYGGGDLETMRSLLAEDLSAYITNAAAGVDRVEGATTSRVMTMIEIKAERQGRMLHNFAAFLGPRERRPGRRALDGRREARLQRRVLVLTSQ